MGVFGKYDETARPDHTSIYLVYTYTTYIYHMYIPDIDRSQFKPTQAGVLLVESPSTLYVPLHLILTDHDQCSRLHQIIQSAG